MQIIYLKVILAIIFTLSVIGKFTGKTNSTFEKAGYGKDIMYATGIVEIILTALMFTHFELWATLGLLAIIGVAIITLLRQKVKPVKFSLPVITAVLLLTLYYLLVS